jgi:predicted kinase
MAEIRILIGLPGCGKSTYRAKLLTQEPDWVTASTDDLIDAYAAEHGLTYTEAFGKVNQNTLKKQFNAMLKKALADGKNVMVDRTNMTAKSRKALMDLAPPGTLRTAVVWSLTDAEHARRLRDRALATGKIIPAYVIRNMANSYVAPTTEEFDRITYIRD